ncbi:CYFA0S26e00100g1_1 [Cyberlindnera fabianii]|uniref:Protein RER1 n=1 Tax=Cyberlindnera fabianii TaxID=36022 RepID=A0A061BA20_CYBFA|nr:Protein RER1 [Cyberlindnera fabianii]CDR46786.1 CYFA0S26e00100g1_1 [Cyberlindnera fabianii]
MDEIPLSEGNPFQQYVERVKVTYRRTLDKSVPHIKYRWSIFGGLLVIFMTRILVSHAWYIVCYALGIYLLNLFLAFLSPKFNPSLQQELQDESIEAGENTEEFRPFIRRLPEFKFWHNASVATVFSLVLTSTSWTDIPVFWPILVMYFITLFVLMMKRQIRDMIKYRYIPFDFGKKKYGSK